MRKKINLYDNRFNNKREKKTSERKIEREREGKLAALEFKAAPFCFCFFCCCRVFRKYLNKYDDKTTKIRV